jgi:hypothetical protein
MKRLLISVFVMSFIFACVSGASYAAQWAKVYGGAAQEAGGLWPAAGGGYYLGGISSTTPSGLASRDALFGKLNASGAVSWAKKIGGPAEDNLYVSETAGGFTVTGMTKSFGTPGSYNLLWAKFNTSWAPVYQKVFGGDGNETGSFFETSDGGHLFLGSSDSYGPDGDTDMLLIKIGPTGNIQWKQVFHYGQQDSASYLIEVSDGYIISGSASGPANPLPGIMLMKLNKSTGQPVWKKLYTHTTKMLVGISLTQLSGENILIRAMAMSFTGSNQILLVKTNAQGVIQWQKTYAKSGVTLTGYQVEENPDSTLILSGTIMDTAGTEGTLIVKLNSAGGIIWKKRLGAASEVNGGFITKTPAGEILLSGMHSSGPDDTSYKTLYAKLNANYAPVWARIFGGTGDDNGYLSKRTGGYLLSGMTNSFGTGIPGKDNIFGMLLDSVGNYSGCSYVTPLTLPVSIPGITVAAAGLTTTANPALTSRTSGGAADISLAVSPVSLPVSNICPVISSEQYEDEMDMPEAETEEQQSQ